MKTNPRKAKVSACLTRALCRAAQSGKFQQPVFSVKFEPELLEPRAHRPEASRISFVFKANHVSSA